MSAEYRLVYDITHDWPALWLPGGGLAVLAFGVLMWYAVRDQPPRRMGAGPRSVSGSPRGQDARAAVALLFISLSALFTLGTAVGVLGSYFAARRAQVTGDARVVEGRVEAFHPMSPLGHDAERFTVAGVRFAYPVSGIGFRQTAPEGGPIREGLFVRIHYTRPWGCDSCSPAIVRLEIRTNGSEPVSPSP